MQRFYIVDSPEIIYPFNMTWECIPLSTGKHLCVVHYGSAIDRKNFEKMDGVMVLPHLLSKNTLHPNHVAHLTEFGVDKSDTTFEAMEKISQKWPQFEIRFY